MSVNELQYVVYSGYLSYRSERKSVSLNANLWHLLQQLMHGSLPHEYLKYKNYMNCALMFSAYFQVIGDKFS